MTGKLVSIIIHGKNKFDLDNLRYSNMYTNGHSADNYCSHSETTSTHTLPDRIIITGKSQPS